MSIAEFFDHTLLKPETTVDQVRQLCQEAIEYQFAGVCIPPYYVAQAAQVLNGQLPRLATVAGFPLGYSATAAKVEEIKRAIEEGAQEVDVVVNIAAIKSGNWNFVRHDIDRMVTSCHLKGKIIKVIIEGGMLTPKEMEKVCAICNELEPDFAKTSTGFNGPGASVEMVKTMRSLLNDKILIKAAGGIRNAEDARLLIEAGANRLGSSSSVAIIQAM